MGHDFHSAVVTVYDYYKINVFSLYNSQVSSSSGIYVHKTQSQIGRLN